MCQLLTIHILLWYVVVMLLNSTRSTVRAYCFQGDKNSNGLRLLKRKLHNCRTKVYLVANIWKTIVTIAMVTIIFSVDCQDGASCIETLYDNRLNATMTSSTFAQTTLIINAEVGSCSKYLPLYIAAVNIVASIVCYRYDNISHFRYAFISQS